MNDYRPGVINVIKSVLAQLLYFVSWLSGCHEDNVGLQFISKLCCIFGDTNVNGDQVSVLNDDQHLGPTYRAEFE